MMCGNIVPFLVGGLLGAGGAITAQWLTYHLNDRRTRRAIAGAFAGEIGAICSIIHRHKYLEQGQQLLERVRQSQQPLRAVMCLTQEYLTIYHSNSSAIGLLPAPLALDVASFYTQIKSLMEDIHPNAPSPITAEDAAAHLTKQISLLTDTLGIGEDLVSRLKKVAE
jgi:hypothetical protein